MLHFSSSPFSTNLQYNKKEKKRFTEKLVTIPLGFLAITIICVFIVSNPGPGQFNISGTPESEQEKNNVLLQPDDQGGMQCDLFEGQWIRQENGSYYTSTNCNWIPDWKNCFKHGRENMDFLNWRWKPEGCQLLRFDPYLFLQIVQHKRMLFLGDSVARNQLESLLCLLSQVSEPTEVENYADESFRELQIKSNNFTIYFMRSTFLVQNEEIMENNNRSTGSFNLHIDKVDEGLARILPAMDYAIISDAHWFFRKNYIYEDGKLIGCVHCGDSNVTNLSLAFAIGKAFRTALNFINACKDCKAGLVTFIRTFSPAHFEGGAWNDGGYCNKTRPSEGELTLGGVDLDIRTSQVAEIERAGKGEKRGRRFEVLDVTKAMLMRPDGHPNSNWGTQWNKGINDCLHWCLPGPIDLWNEFLLALLKK